MPSRTGEAGNRLPKPLDSSSVLVHTEYMPTDKVQRVCSLPECERKHRGRGYCDMHLQRLVKHGDVRADRPRHYKATGPDSPEWQGSDIGYGQAHTRVRKARGKASQAVCTCGRAATDWAYDGLDENEKTSPEGLVYSADPDRYVAMCRSCHLKQDGVAPTVEAKKLGLETRWGK